MRHDRAADNILQARAGGRVERCHILPHAGSYSNASHQWGVAMLMYYLWPEDFPRLAIYCLTHDVAEAWVGDIPAPMTRYCQQLRAVLPDLEGRLLQRWGMPSLADLSEQDMRKLKTCDALEFYLWCREQADMGNSMVMEGQREVERYFEETPLIQPARGIYNYWSSKRSLRPRMAGVIKEELGE